MKELMESVAALEDIAAGDMTRESMIHRAKVALGMEPEREDEDEDEGGCSDVRCVLPADHTGPCREEDEDTEEEEPEADEPDEDAITTTDDRTFYQYGKLVLTIGEDDDREEALIAFMDQQQFWPDCWSISDHGNAHRIDLTEKRSK